MHKYRAAIVGCGRIASLFSKDPLRKGIVTHAAAYRTNPYTELIAACDIDKARIREFGNTWGVSSLYTNLNEMLEREAIDIVSICTPPNTHYPILKTIAKFSIKAIFCEKPLADSLRDAKEMVRLCREKKIILQVDHQRRFDLLHLQLRKLIKNRKFGKVQQVNFYYTAGIKNTGSHMFDILRFLFGDIEWVEAFFSKNISVNEKDPNLDGILKFKNGIFATFQACDVKRYLVFELNCFFEKGRIVLKNSGFDVDFYSIGYSRYFSGYKELFKVRHSLKTRYKRNLMVNAIRHIIECINNGKKSISSGSEGLKAVELIEKSIFSAKNNGRKIFLD